QAQRFLGSFRQGLQDLGLVEGRNIVLEYRWAEGKYERLPGLAAELVRLKVDIIFAATFPVVQAAQHATGTIPIVMPNVEEPVESGLVASIARPGSNITGLSIIASELVGKQLELLRECVPKVSQVAVLWNSTNPGNGPQLRAAESAAHALGMRVQPL